MADTLSIVRKRGGIETKQLLDELLQKRAQLSTKLLQSGSKKDAEAYGKDIAALTARVEELEVELSLRSREFRTQTQPITLAAVQQAIPQNGVLVEYGIYQPFDAKANKHAPARYVAYLLTNQGEPLWVELGEVVPIDQAINALRVALRDKRSNIATTVKTRARLLDRMVMKPVRKLIGQARHLFIAPDGALNLIPFDALVDEKGRYLVQQYEISYLTSGRDLLRLGTETTNQQPAMVIADPNFGSNIDPDAGPKLGNVELQPLKRLSASAQEAIEIKANFPNAILLAEDKATKSALQAVVRPSLLHIATHGFFLASEDVAEIEESRSIVRRITGNNALEDRETNTMVMDNPLLRSGLFFAGANLRNVDATLTAFEVAQLDLQGTKLVVLSACDTGLGEVKNGEGVYGLRRALVLAGAQTQVISLWPVSDLATRDLMIAYYQALKTGEGRSSALRKVRLKMLRSAIHRHPYYWASFIPSGEWANLSGKR
jgi:CHAT domain-containing protein